MVYKVLLWTEVFWISYIKWYKFCNNNLLVVLRSKQGGTLKLMNPKHKDWASIQLLTFSVLIPMFTLPRCQVIFQWKQKEKLGNAKSMKSRQNGNRKRNSMIKSKQISFEVTCAWDCFTTWKVICILYLYWNVFQEQI